MNFARAAGLAPYLKKLGVSHLYASPLFTATAGSTHGYDVTDHGALDPALGGITGFNMLDSALKAQDLGLILDIVPNHMAASLENPWYYDVLRHGAESRYARHFDIDWSAPKLLVTTLGEPYGTVLEWGEFALTRLADGPAFTIYDKAFPLTPRSWETVFDTAPKALPSLPETPHVDARTEWFEALIANPKQAAILASHLSQLSDDKEALHRIHEAQHWRLSYWRAARDTLTHRRFFEITDLIGVRVEDEAVFDAVHEKTFAMIEQGQVHGLRIDHVDGLADPARYLEQLRDKLPRDVPVWIEKILGHGELLPADWHTVGTTGYEVTNWIANTLVNANGQAPLKTAFEKFGGTASDPLHMLEEAKREILTRNLAAELRLLTSYAQTVAQNDPVARDYGFDTLRRAIIALTSAMPVYRTYLDDGPASEADARLIKLIQSEAQQSVDVEDTGAVNFIAGLLLNASEPGSTHSSFRRRFQQTTGALLAKALEDTLFYRDHSFVALNEVGGEPGRFSLTPDKFATEVAARAENQKLGIVATASHDTKRGADTRMRQLAIADHPDLWQQAVDKFDQTIAQTASEANLELPEADMRWLFYQSLLGAWEGDTQDATHRLTEYLVKAAREAKGETSWVRTDDAYEKRLADFVALAMSESDGLAEFLQSCEPIILTGEWLGLAQTALHLTLPGIPDIYQGSEGGDFSLVDPDNRRPPNFDALEAALSDEQWTAYSGRKLNLTHKLLSVRNRIENLFAEGDFVQAKIESGNPRTISFFRNDGENTVLVLVSPTRVAEPVTVQAEGSWQSLMSDRAQLEAPENRLAVPADFFDGPVAIFKMV
jgi:(1->4)-alpha-D-glucan 1-alpha-D-glucosylmutase